jgi:hypothetical protein
MIVYLNANGTIQQVVPQTLTQGSNNENLIVVGANLSNYTSLSAIFKLPNKQVLAPQLMTKQDSNYVLNNEIVNVWTCKITKSVTNFSGTLELTIDATDVNGVKVNSYSGAVQIAPTSAPVFPAIDESAEEVFNKIFEAYGFIQGELASKQDQFDDGLETIDKSIVGAINELNEKETQNTGDIANLESQIEDIENGNTIVEKARNDQNGDNIANTYQKKEDNNLSTLTKTVVGGINELNQGLIEVKGRFSNYYPKTETYNRDEINALLVPADNLTKQVVQELPTANINPNVLYLVPKQDAQGDDYYEEYLYINGKWELIGTTLTGARTTLIRVNTTIETQDLYSIVELSDEQYSELIAYGQITVNGEVLIYSDNVIYVTPDISEPNTLTFSGTSVLTSAETFNSHIQILVEFETDSIHAGFDCVLHPYDEAVCFVTYNVLVNGSPNFGTAYLNEDGQVVINVPSGLTFSNVHAKYVVFGG